MVFEMMEQFSICQLTPQKTELEEIHLCFQLVEWIRHDSMVLFSLLFTVVFLAPRRAPGT